MPSYKFKVGDAVILKPKLHQNVPGGLYEVTKVLPSPNGEREYRIKSVNEPHERVARESELTEASRNESTVSAWRQQAGASSDET